MVHLVRGCIFVGRTRRQPAWAGFDRTASGSRCARRRGSARGLTGSRVKQDVTGVRISGEQRFQRGRRLRSPLDFARVRRRGRHISGPLLSLTYARREAEPGVAPAPTRIGFSVSKRVGGAVERNRVKRRLREAVRHRLAAMAPGWDVVVTARSGIAETPFAALDAALADALTRARLWPAELASSESSESSECSGAGASSETPSPS